MLTTKMTVRSVSLKVLLVIAASAIIPVISVSNEELTILSYNQTGDGLDLSASLGEEEGGNRSDDTNSTIITDNTQQPRASFNWDAIRIITQTTGALFMFGSIWIIGEILSDH